MENIKDTFTLERSERTHNTDEYMQELQDTIDKLSDLICNAGKYISNDESESDCPIWEYVINENRGTIPYIITDLMTRGCESTLDEDKIIYIDAEGNRAEGVIWIDNNDEIIWIEGELTPDMHIDVKRFRQGLPV